MRGLYAGVAGGLAAGVVMSLVMVEGRRLGLLHKTLAEDSEDWLDRTAGTRRRIGEGGTTALEQANHMAAAGFGLGYGVLRRWLRGVPAPVLGSLYGAGLYTVNIAGVAPLLGITQGEQNAPPALRAERLGLHLLYGVVTAIVADAAARPRG